MMGAMARLMPLGALALLLTAPALARAAECTNRQPFKEITEFVGATLVLKVSGRSPITY